MCSFAYSIYNCRVPVISAVGHETDFTIADLTADMRAPTPSAAAELAAPSVESLYEKIDIIDRRIERSVLGIFDRATDSFVKLNSRIAAQSPENRLKIGAERLNSLERAIGTNFVRYMDRQYSSLSEKASRLEALSPLKVLSRGYSLVYKDGELIKSSETVSEGDKIGLRFGNGGADALIIRKW